MSGTAVYGYTLYRDPSGRIFHKVETTQGTTDTLEYGYDDAGRLCRVPPDERLTQDETP